MLSTDKISNAFKAICEEAEKLQKNLATSFSMLRRIGPGFYTNLLLV